MKSAFGRRWGVAWVLAAFGTLLGGGAIAATVATNAVSLAVRVEGSELRFSWGPAGAGARYRIEASGSLANPVWEPLGDATGETQWSLPLPALSPRFFRLAVTEAPARGRLETQVLLRTFTSAELKALMAGYGLPALGALPTEAWRVVYSTIDAFGQPTVASALVAIPVGAGTALPLISYQHGTLTQREDAPSRLVGEADVGLILASGGYLAVLPDYLGLGDSPGFHPYQHAASEASAVVDALRAARGLAGVRGQALNGQVFLTGYSQGGHATMAAQRELEVHHAGEFTLTASAPCAGAYDMSGVTADDFLSDRRPPNPYYAGYLLYAYARIYSVAPSVASLLKAPYDTTVPPLFDGEHGSGVINAAMPPRPADALKDEVLAAFRTDPNHPLRLALRDNDLHRDWVPQTPTRLFHCSGDQDVLPANSTVAYNAFKAAGAPSIQLLDPVPSAGHSACAPFSLFAVKLWFDGLKR